MKKKLWNRIPVLGVLVVMTAMLLSSVSVAQAQQCDPGIRDAMENHAEAMRARDKSYAMQNMPRNDPSLGMSCFDQAMGLTGKLGNIFSDVHVIPATFNPTIAVGLGEYLTTLGATVPLISDIDSVVTGSLKDILGNFSDSLSAILGTTLTTLFDAFMGPINSALGPLLGAPGLGPWLSSLMSSLLPSGMSCDLMATLWNDGFGGIESVIGEGVGSGIEFYDFNDILTGSPVGAGARFLNELNAGGNPAVLGDVINDMSTMVPGNPAYPSYKTTPIFGATPDTATVIGAM